MFFKKKTLQFMNIYRTKANPSEIKEYVLLGATVLLVVAVGWWYLLTLPYIWKTRELAADFGLPYPHPSELWPSLVSLALLCLLRPVCMKYFLEPLGIKLLDVNGPNGKMWDSEEKEARVVRFSACMFKFLYFVFIFVWYLCIVGRMEWIPPTLFGNGATHFCWKDFPFQKLTPEVSLYYNVQLSYHLHSLVFHVCVQKHRNDFYEMILHHITTIFLMYFAWEMNTVRIGVLVLIVHDIADIAAYATKAAVDIPNKKVTMVLFINLLGCWIYARLYSFPMNVIYSIRYEYGQWVGDARRIGVHSFLVMLFILLGLHIYWFGLFLVMGLKFAKSGKPVDIIGKIEEGQNQNQNDDENYNVNTDVNNNKKKNVYERYPHSIVNDDDETKSLVYK